VSLRGQLLVATPTLLDPNFRRAVVLIAEHGEEGAMGLVLNRASPADVGEAVPELEPLTGADATVHIGGPVQPEAVIALAEFDDPGDAAAMVVGDVGFVPAETGVEFLAVEVRRARIFAGYAGWTAGQLEAEIEDAAWIVVSAVPDDVFCTDPDELWGAVLRRQGGAFALLSTMPADPSLN
jgi:putative transcriptional regulator